ncbi:MAG: LPS export ABC transporter permease LptF [Alphaproteobacteria bacterium]|nr:LPS export ABC transporter permease LptF [Alphaproteobacteria bacterium]
MRALLFYLFCDKSASILITLPAEHQKRLRPLFSFSLFDGYLVKNLFLTMIVTALTLAAIILLTQSLRFLELIVNSGASSAAFWGLTFLALPRFFEVILPVAVMIATLFIYHRLNSDSEIVVMRAAGGSPMQLARPAFLVGICTTLILLFITMWLAPVSLNNMQKMRQVIKAQYSTILFRPGIFNQVGKDLTVYIDSRNRAGEMEGLLIHDSRKNLPAPVTVIAKKGVVVATDEGQQVLVYDGSRQDFKEKTGALNRLDFERYSIDLPEPKAVRQRWREPDERTFFELLNPDPADARDLENKEKFLIEAHRRVISPFLTLSFIAIVLCFLLLGPTNRRGQTRKMMLAVLCVIILQGLYLALFNIATSGMWGLALLYLIVLGPLAGGIFLLSSWAEHVRHKMFYVSKKLKSSDELEGSEIT